MKRIGSGVTAFYLVLENVKFKLKIRKRMEKELGKIESVKFGLGGYQGAMIGIHISLSSKGWGTNTEVSAWDSEIIECTEHCKWNEESRSKQYDEMVRYISKLLKSAKVQTIDELKDKPVEVIFENNSIKEWRILDEVL